MLLSRNAQNADEGRARIIFVDYHPYTPLTEDNLLAHPVRLRVFHGDFDHRGWEYLMRDRQLVTLDEAAIAEALALAPRDIEITRPTCRRLEIGPGGDLQT
jgi:hypothetical protein